MALVHASEATSFAVILHDSAGEVSTLPLGSSSGDNTVSVTVAAGQGAYLPALSRAWRLTGPAGAETFYVLSSRGAIKQDALSALLKEISNATTRGVQQVDVPMSPRDFDPLISGVIENFVRECRSCALTKFVAFHK